MTRMTLTQKELENKVERALENACAYLAVGGAKLAFDYYCEANTYLDLLEDMGVWYYGEDEDDEEMVINEHVQDMMMVLKNANFKVTAYE